MISEIKRAGTAQILQSVNIADLYALWVKCRVYNGYSTKNSDFVLSHICPVVNISGSIALLDPENLVITTRSYNAARKNQWDGYSGKHLPVSARLAKFDVDDSTSKAAIVALIRSICFGFDDFLTEVKLALTASAKLHNRLKKLGYPYPEWTPYDDLVAALELHSGLAQDTSGFMNFYSETASTVYLNECARIGAFATYKRDGARLRAKIDWDSLHTTHEKGMAVWIAKNTKGLGKQWRYTQEIIKPCDFDPDTHLETRPDDWNDAQPWAAHYRHNEQFYTPYHCF